jgi:hypothetical protein
MRALASRPEDSEHQQYKTDDLRRPLHGQRLLPRWALVSIGQLKRNAALAGRGLRTPRLTDGSIGRRFLHPPVATPPFPLDPKEAEETPQPMMPARHERRRYTFSLGSVLRRRSKVVRSLEQRQLEE